MTDATPREELAVVLYVAWGNWYAGEPEREFWQEALADAVLDSDWLAAHDAKVLRDAVERFESEVGPGELDEQTSRDGIHWVNVEESWNHQGVFMDWLRAEADRVEAGA